VTTNRGNPEIIAPRARSNPTGSAGEALVGLLPLIVYLGIHHITKVVDL
jgi:hypothetical protein